MVLWVLVMLSIMAFNYLGSSRWESLSTRNLKDETVAHYIALSGYHEAMFYLMSDKDPTFDYSDNNGNFWIDKDTPPVTGKKVTEGGEVEISITDEDAKVNINIVPPERLRSLFLYAGIPEDTVTEIVDSVIDWKDPDEEHHLSGAESDYYEGLDNPYKAKNGLFDLPEELILVKGMKREYLYGSSEVKALLPMITTFGNGTVNINTVSTETMQMLGLDNFEIEAVLKQRTEDAGGFKFIPPQFAARGLNAVATNDVRIEVIAKAVGGGPASKIVAVVNRQRAAKGYKIQTLYWREGA